MALPPCSTSSSLSTTAMVFFIPLLAAVYCIMQLLYRSLFGLNKLFKTDDYENLTKNKMVVGYAALWFLLLTLTPLIYYSLTENYTQFKLLVQI